MIHADHALARRLEGLICVEFRRLADVARSVLPGAGAECIDAAGGVALWLGEGSPVNMASGQGMSGPVDDAGLARLEAFYHRRGAPAIIGVCPLADASLIEALGRRGWAPLEFEHVLVLELDDWCIAGKEAEAPGTLDPGVELRLCSTQDRQIWGRTATMGFSDGQPPGQGHEEFGTIMAGRDDAILVLAWADGEPAGTGALVVDGGVGWLSGDSTLPRFRGRGVQQAIQRYRLQMAREAGCDLAVTEAAPGGGSQRNMERLGFRIVYMHVEFVRPPASSARR